MRKSRPARLSTLCIQVLVIGAILGREGRHTVLRLGLRDRWRHRFAALLQRIAALAISTVAQFAELCQKPYAQALETASASPPTPSSFGA